MKRYLLDTNILVFLGTFNVSEISLDVADLLSDYGNKFYTSSISIIELLQLYRIGRLNLKKGQKIHDVLDYLQNELAIETVPFTKSHTETLANLSISDGHNDPFDHAIISHAITDRYTLISSDRKFKDYECQRLQFVFNKR